MKRWQAFWFAPSSPAPLGICRALFFGLLLPEMLDPNLSLWGDVSPVFLAHPWFRLPILPESALRMLQIVWYVSLITSAIGLWTRGSMAVAFLLGAYLLAVPEQFGKVNHTGQIVVLVLAVLACSRAGDAWSLDALRKRKSRSRPPPSGEYTWPIKMVWVIMAVIFFSAGVAKLRASGFGWALSDNLAITLLQHQYFHHPLTRWGLTISRVEWLCIWLAATSLCLELAYPLALISRRARAVLVPSLFAIQVGILLTMGPTFTTFFICNVFWVPWDNLLERGRLCTLTFNGDTH